MSIEALVARYGLAALFAGAALEGEAAVVTGGLLVHQDLFSLPGAIAAAAAGSFVADQAWFAIGRRYRDWRPIARLRGTSGYARAAAALERHPRAFIFSFRFIWGLRTVSPVAIGTTDVPRMLYAAINAVSAIVWAITFVFVGYLFGEAFEEAVGRLRHDARLWWIAGALLVAGAVIGAIHWWRRR